MRQLTEQEEKIMQVAITQYKDKTNRTIIGLRQIEGDAFEFGFIAGLSYQDKRIEALEAFIAGKITRDELERVTK